MNCSYIYKNNIYTNLDNLKLVISQEEIRDNSKETLPYFESALDLLKNNGEVIPHEYAHHYIAWFRNTPLVQEAIKKWGSEEALVQVIGEQSAKQKGKAWKWWQEFKNWMIGLFSDLNNKDKEELKNIITDAFLQGVDLETGQVGISEQRSRELAKDLGSYMLAEVEFSKLQKEEFIIQNNGTFLYLPEERKQEIYNNYVNLMDRKREGKAITFEKFQQVFDNLQVYKHKNTFIFGEWDVKNNIFKGRLMSSPGIKELYSSLDVLFSNVDFVASVPSDIGKMLEKKGLYKLDVGKEYNFRGEEMVKNLYFTNKELVEKVFKKPAENVTEQEVREYDKFYNYWSLIYKLKEEYENKNYDNLIPILKEIGIYDYNAYRLVKKIKQGKITNDDAESIVKEIIKNSAINKINIDKTDLINNPEIYNELNTELNKTLATYLSKFGIKTELLEDIQNKLNIDSFAHIDILNKIIYADKNNTQDYPQQAGKVIAYMMQHNPIVQEITSKMKRLSMFKNLTNDELFEAVGDLISQELHKKTNTELPKSLIDSVKNLIRQFFDFINNVQLARINKNIAFIADNILIQNQSLITQSTFKPGSVGKKTTKVSLEEALKQDSFANSIVEKMAEYFILTGSITLSEQGTVYRPDENQVHDLDWVSSLPRDISIKIFNQLYPNNKHIRNIYNKEYQTDTWLIAPKGYEIVNLQIDNSKGTNKITGYDIVDKNGNIVSSYIPLSDSHTGKVEAKLIDIFTYENITEEKTKNKEITLNSGIKLKIANWRNTFAAKLEFGRLKDIWDYNRFIPNENLFQIDLQKSQERLNQIKEVFNENPELANSVYEALGFNNIVSSKVELKHKIAHVYDIIYNGKRIGNFELPLDLEGASVLIGDVEIDEEYRGKGLGVETYKAAINLSPKPIESLLATPEANRVWESLVKQNLAIKTEDGYRTIKPSIDSQQKQQAQQKFQEYINVTGKQDIQGFKEFVQGKQYMVDNSEKQYSKNSQQTTNTPDVILPIGTSGSGKSTWIKSLPQENLVVISPDEMRKEFTGDINDKSKDKEIYVEAANRAIKAIKQGKQVVFDTTNLTKEKRLPFIEAIRKEFPNANIQYKLMELNPELAKQRIKNRLKTNPPVEKFDGFWNRSQVANQTNKVFLFGDNTNDRTVTNYVPSMTQAVIRGLPNAIGIDTKKDRGTSINSYLTDNDLEWFKGHVDTQIQKAKDSGKTIVVPADGIGTGKAMLKEKAPKLFKYLQEKLRELELTQGANVSDATIDRHAESYKQMLEDIKEEPISNYEVSDSQKQQAIEYYIEKQQNQSQKFSLAEKLEAPCEGGPNI